MEKIANDFENEFEYVENQWCINLDPEEIEDLLDDGWEIVFGEMGDNLIIMERRKPCPRLFGNN